MNAVIKLKEVYMKILVMNCGSSSLKYQLIDMEGEKLIAKGLVERIGIEGSIITHTTIGKDKVKTETPMKDHNKAVELVIKALIDPESGAIASMDEIDAVGHRVVHGGEEFAESVVIDDKVMKGIESCNDLAPLHNPANIIGIEACKKAMPNVPNVAVFDTSFHQTMPASSYLYALPYEYYEKYKVRRYGFHGTSHKYVTKRAAEMLEKKPEELNLITCHLGNGASISAVEKGKSVDTSMGLTPLEGLAMGTRCGDMDPAIVTFIMQKEGLTPQEMDNVMNKKSGMQGLSELSSDFRDLEEGYLSGNKKAIDAIDVFVKRVKKYIGAYYAELGKVDAIIFTAGIGENSGFIREKVLTGLEGLGIEFDKSKNDFRGEERFINKDSSQVKILVIPTNEELTIARDTLELTK